LPALHDVLTEGRTLRDSMVAAQRSGYFRDTSDDDLDALYDARS
jgi:hypothetical protein